jgi:hypothetical protein
MTFAVNVDPRFNDGAPDPQHLYDIGFRGVRYTSTPEGVDYADRCLTAGVSVLAIITGESKGFLMPNATYYQIGNEPDAQSTLMTPAQYADMWVLYRNTYPDFKMFSAGLASGGENMLNYWLAVEQQIRHRAPQPDAIAIHPYLKNHVEAAGEFDMMWNQFQIPIIATEWYVNPQTNDMWDFVCMLNNPDDGRSTMWNSWFCWTDEMVGPFGLLDRNNNPKDEYSALLSAPCLTETLDAKV